MGSKERHPWRTLYPTSEIPLGRRPTFGHVQSGYARSVVRGADPVERRLTLPAVRFGITSMAKTKGSFEVPEMVIEDGVEDLN